MIGLGLAVAWDGKGPRPVGMEQPVADTCPNCGRAFGVAIEPAPLPVPPRPPFDWSGLWAQVGPLVYKAVLVALAAVASYFGVAANSQSKQNGETIRAVHAEAERHGRQLDRMAGNVADRVPGKGN
jgi:hypothetical protein